MQQKNLMLEKKSFRLGVKFSGEFFFAMKSIECFCFLFFANLKSQKLKVGVKQILSAGLTK